MASCIFKQNLLYRLRINNFLKSRSFLPSRSLATQATNYYDVLEVSPQSSQTQIKSAYYRLSKKYHPDVATTSSADKFARLSAAYEVLSNPRNRQQYDIEVLGHGNRAGLSVDMDSEYREFLRNRGKFRNRNTGKVHTGRSTIFNFDEFYRQHYGDSVRQAHSDKRAKEFKARVQEESKSMDSVMFGYTVFLVISMAAVWTLMS